MILKDHIRGLQQKRVFLYIFRALPNLKVKGKKAIAKKKKKSYNKTVTPQNYNSTQKAFEAYKNGGTYKAIGISKVNITGVEGKKVGTIKLSNPPSPSGI